VNNPTNLQFEGTHNYFATRDTESWLVITYVNICPWR